MLRGESMGEEVQETDDNNYQENHTNIIDYGEKHYHN